MGRHVLELFFSHASLWRPVLTRSQEPDGHHECTVGDYLQPVPGTGRALPAASGKINAIPYAIGYLVDIADRTDLPAGAVGGPSPECGPLLPSGRNHAGHLPGRLHERPARAGQHGALYVDSRTDDGLYRIILPAGDSQDILLASGLPLLRQEENTAADRNRDAE